MSIRTETLVLGQQRSKVLQSYQENGELIDAVEMNVGLNRFGLWLKEFCGRLVLVGHNVWAFDVNHFWINFKKPAFGGFASLLH